MPYVIPYYFSLNFLCPIISLICHFSICIEKNIKISKKLNVFSDREPLCKLLSTNYIHTDCKKARCLNLAIPMISNFSIVAAKYLQYYKIYSAKNLE